MFLFPVKAIVTTQIKAASARKACASTDVASGLRRGRHAISITAEDADIAVGNDSVTATTGMLVKAGTTMVIPVDNTVTVPFYAIGGTFRLGEYF